MPKTFLIAVAALFAFAGAAAAQEEHSADQCAQAWAEASESQSLGAVQDFIRDYTDCAEADQARQDVVAVTGQELVEDQLSAQTDEETPDLYVQELPAPGDDSGSSDAHHHGHHGYTAAPPPPAPPPPPGPLTASIPSQGPGFSMPSDRTVYIPSGRLLKRGDAMVAEGGGYGVILLQRNAPENLAACQVFVRSLGFTATRDDGLVEQVDGVFVYRRPIYWLTLHNTSATRASDCPTMLANYDYDRAAIMLARLQANNRSGPFMVIWRADGRSAGLFDYSELSPTDLDTQFDRSLFNFVQSDQIWTPAFYERNSFEARLRALIAGIAAPAKFVSATLINFRPPTIRISQ